MYDLCLLNPPHPDLVNPHAQAPLGILYLAAVAERAGLTVAVRNLAGAKDDPLRRIPAADAYGITGTFLDVPAVHALAGELRLRNPDATIIVGGPIALSARQLDGAPIDIIVHGDGDNFIVGKEMPRRLAVQPETGVPAPAEIAVEEWEGPPQHVYCDPVTDLDSLPFPARHLWAGPLGGNIFLNGQNFFGNGSTTVLTSRGCPMSCAFCAGPALAPRAVRFRSPDSVVAELEHLARDFGIRQYRFSDEYFTCKRAHVEGICDGILRSKILQHGDGCAWRVSVGVRPADPDLFRLMRAAGCREIAIGIESADDAVLAILNKKQTAADAVSVIYAAKSAGLRTRALMMCGTPGERPETLRRNLVFLRTVPFDALAMTVFTPVPGSAIAEHPETFRCKLKADSTRSLCLFGPDGENRISPTIEIEGVDDAALTAQMRATVSAAERTGKLGTG